MVNTRRNNQRNGNAVGNNPGRATQAALRVQTITPPTLDQIGLTHIKRFESDYKQYVQDCVRLSGGVEGNDAMMQPTPKVQCLSKSVKTFIAVQLEKYDENELTEEEATEWLEGFEEMEILTEVVESEEALKGVKMKRPKRRDQIVECVSQYIMDVQQRLVKNNLLKTIGHPVNGKDLRKQLIPKIIDNAWPEAAVEILKEEWKARGRSSWTLKDFLDRLMDKCVTYATGKIIEEAQNDRGDRGRLKFNPEKKKDDREDRNRSEKRQDRKRHRSDNRQQSRNRRSYDDRQTGGKKRKRQEDGTVVCYACGRKGHMSYECKAPDEEKERRRALVNESKRVQLAIRSLREKGITDTADESD